MEDVDVTELCRFTPAHLIPSSFSTLKKYKSFSNKQLGMFQTLIPKRAIIELLITTGFPLFQASIHG